MREIAEGMGEYGERFWEFSIVLIVGECFGMTRSGGLVYRGVLFGDAVGRDAEGMVERVHEMLIQQH